MRRAVTSAAASAMRLLERDEPPLLFVPQHQAYRPETLRDGQPAGGGEGGEGAKDLGKPVEGNPAGKMMDMVDADIRAEPAQDRGQLVVRAPAQRRLVEGPVLVSVPLGVLELMLHIEEPDADRRRDQGDRDVHQQE